MARKKAKRSRTSHNPGLKKSMRSRGVRLVHGYETTRRSRGRRRKK